MRYYVYIVSLCAVIAACNPNNKAETEAFGKPLARVKEKYLYLKDVSPMLLSTGDSLDSMIVLRNLINNWVEEQLMLDRAQLNLTAEQLNFERQIEDYRKSLILFKYEQELLRQKLDTVVSDEEIEKYYQENKQNFELKDYVAKVSFVKVVKEAPKVGKVKEWLFSDDTRDRKKLEEYCLQYATAYILDDQWMFFDELTEFIPIQTINVEHFLKTTRKVESVDDKFMYILKISEFKLKNSISPLALEGERIRAIILNKRKLAFLMSFRKSLIQDALNRNEAEVSP